METYTTLYFIMHEELKAHGLLSVCFSQYYRPRITKVHFKETQFELRVLGKDVSFYLYLKRLKK